MPHHLRRTLPVLLMIPLMLAAAAPEEQGAVPEADEQRQATLQALIESLEAQLDDASDDVHLQIELAKALHLKGVAGDEKATSRSGKMLERLHTAYPDRADVTAYLGSHHLIRASRTLAVWRKGRLTKKGLANLDMAVNDAPTDLEVRFIRAVTTAHLPAWMEREEQSREDFAWLAPQVEAAVADDQLKPYIGASVMLYHGDALLAQGNQDDAIEAWTVGEKIAPQSNAGAECLDKLNALGKR